MLAHLKSVNIAHITDFSSLDPYITKTDKVMIKNNLTKKDLKWHQSMADSFQPAIWLAAINQGRAPLSHESPGAVFSFDFFL